MHDCTFGIARRRCALPLPIWGDWGEGVTSRATHRPTIAGERETERRRARRCSPRASSGWAAGDARSSTRCRARARTSASSLAYTRTRASAEEFCREKACRSRQLRRDPGRSEHRRGRARDAAQPARGQVAAAAAGKHIHVEKPITLDRPARMRRSRPRARPASCWRSVLPALPSVGRRDPRAARGRPARRGRLDGGAAHHQHRPVHPAGQLARRARGGAGRRTHRGRRAFARPHDRVRRPGARRALRDRPLHSAARPTTPPA